MRPQPIGSLVNNLPVLLAREVVKAAGDNAQLAAGKETRRTLRVGQGHGIICITVKEQDVSWQSRDVLVEVVVVARPQEVSAHVHTHDWKAIRKMVAVWTRLVHSIV